MKLSGFLLPVLICAASIPAFSQEKAVVMYDPLFWKDDLKLSNTQCQKIKDINFEFFQQINSLISESRVVVPAKTAELLTDRSEKIWSTFERRQKKKWKKNVVN